VPVVFCDFFVVFLFVLSLVISNSADDCVAKLGSDLLYVVVFTQNVLRH